MMGIGWYTIGICNYLDTRKEEGLNQVMQMSAGSGKSGYFCPSRVCLPENTGVSEHRTTTSSYLLILTSVQENRDKMLTEEEGLVPGVESIVCEMER